ncbi:MAG: Na+/H+ antiporter NhaC family protein [Lachnospiraceae bacterium]|nr:Na+/H+ antiporter NhaC family protein [Lachnospiraceae bacterium]MBR5944389.1 Na+/H+ antiporter NhaC family protein [Lachnospiraceae bacterium]
MKKNKVLIASSIFIVMLVLIAVLNACGVNFVASAWALLPPLVAIILALVTKEAYSSLFVGIVLGAVMAAGCDFKTTLDMITVDSISTAVADNAGILVFLVILGTIVALVNKSGASRAFGNWAQKHIKTKVGAMMATFLLGVLIFIDDYFNCLTVGSVMAPVTDSKKISRVKLAYLIDATAAPVCMIAPVSSWAAAVSGCVESETYSGIDLFIRAIPYNFYSILTFVFIIAIVLMGFDYGKMSEFEIKAQKTGDLSVLDIALLDAKQERKLEEEGPESPARGKLIDLIIPIVILIICCIWGLLHNGYQSIGEGSVIDAFSETDAYVGLPWGCILALVLVIIYLIARKIVTFEEAMECIPKGFISMVPAILILTLATGLKNMTGALEVKTFVHDAMLNAQGLQWALPAIVFVVACLIAFATGTSWGTFGILIPIVSVVFPETSSLFFVGISACLAGAVCGDHCSPISDTTIMSSAGAHCNHIDHVETQLPYAISVAVISFITYIIAGLLDMASLTWISIPVGVVLTICFLFGMKKRQEKAA